MLVTSFFYIIMQESELHLLLKSVIIAKNGYYRWKMGLSKMNKKIWKRVLAATALMTAVLCTGNQKEAKETCFWTENVYAEETDVINFDETESVEEAETLSPEEVVWPDIEENILDGKDMVNILLIGQDKREGENRQRSDTMILATLNLDEKKISITSFMRDLYVQIPGYSDNRINAAYAFGGMELLDEVMETNFGIQIDGNVEVDFSGFEAIIDMLGGVEIELSQAEADYICGRAQNVLYPQQYREDWLYLTEGVNTLTGEQALIHARNRSIGNSDYERTKRQRDVLTACFEKVKDASVWTLLSLVDDAFDMMTTDITHGEMLGYAMNILNLGFDNLESYRIPQDGAYRSAVISQMQVLVPDLEMCRNYLAEIL